MGSPSKGTTRSALIKFAPHQHLQTQASGKHILQAPFRWLSKFSASNSPHFTQFAESLKLSSQPNRPQPTYTPRRLPVMTLHASATLYASIFARSLAHDACFRLFAYTNLLSTTTMLPGLCLKFYFFGFLFGVGSERSYAPSTHLSSRSNLGDQERAQHR